MLTQIIEICLIPLLGILTKYFVDFLDAKRKEINTKTNSELAKKYTDMIYKTVRDCVIATNQTYVDSLKKNGAFTKEAQQQALDKTMAAVKSLLSEDAQEYIISISGDLTLYLTQIIEAEVNKNKGTLN